MGIHLAGNFPDPDNLLQTAYADFREFLKSIGLNDAGPCPVIITHIKTSIFEEYNIIVGKDGIILSAGDTEGVRRGLIQLEDMIIARDNYCLPLGITNRKPVICTRLSRCFYGPINRPPKCRDELNDGGNYYPDGYLNRLAHNGINALWLTIKFKDICPSKIIPELSAGSTQRLDKLRRTVKQCLRYGIKIYPFCIEPAALPGNSPVFKAHPELKGHLFQGEFGFCTSAEIGRAYVEEATRNLFSLAPGLGGLVIIPVGERFTHCCSFFIPEGGQTTEPISCPRCSRRKPYEVLADTLGAFEHGMHSVAPDAELIAWPYSQIYCWGSELTVTAAEHMPKNVILQHNFESGGRVKQLGKWRSLWDYWLSWVGPSKIFADCARATRKNKTRMFAKLQTSCSHEVATTQYVPVPGIIYQKYKKMHDLGVSGVMQGWYFGNYPSLMTKASQMLSFAPFPKTEKGFLLSMAARNWGRHAPQIVKAWGHFKDGYSQYPGDHLFGYYGPMHDGVVWPLYLEPRHLPLSPTWRIVHPTSGDQVGECFSPDFNYDEVLVLCKRMRDHWRKGVEIINRLEIDDRLSAECRREINTARALGLQFESGYNILFFYFLRDKLATAKTCRRQKALLKELRSIVLAEIDNDKTLLKLCAENKTLGFHSEAEGYKYFPEKIKWRIDQLRALLNVEFPRVAKQTGQYPLPSFENYIGQGSSIQAYKCAHVQNGTELVIRPFSSKWNEYHLAQCKFWAGPRASEANKPFPFNTTLYPLSVAKAPPSGISWRAAFDDKAIYFCLEWQAETNRRTLHSRSDDDEIRITIEPVRLGPGISFVINKNNPASAAAGPDKLKTHTETRGRKSRLTVTLPFKRLGPAARQHGHNIAMRINISGFFSPITDPLHVTGKPLWNSWAPTRRTMPRNCFGYIDPANYGWLVFDRNKGY